MEKEKMGLRNKLEDLKETAEVMFWLAVAGAAAGLGMGIGKRGI